MTIDILDQTRVAAEVATTDRRRPGRPETVSPQLLSLLRAEERAKLTMPLEPADAAYDRRLDAGQGLALGLDIGALMWGAIVATGWAMLTG